MCESHTVTKLKKPDRTEIEGSIMTSNNHNFVKGKMFFHHLSFDERWLTVSMSSAIGELCGGSLWSKCNAVSVPLSNLLERF